MNRRWLLGITLGALVGLAAPGVAGAQAPGTGDGSGPTLQAHPARVELGGQLRISGNGWPANTLVTVEICGNRGENGSIDCDQPQSRTIAAGRDGRLSGTVHAAVPPTPCPCVVRGTVPGSAAVASAPVDLAGAPFSALRPAADVGPQRQLEVTAVELRGGRWTEWFGAPARRTLHLTVANTGVLAVQDAVVRLHWGRSPDPSGMIEPSRLGEIRPGESATVEIPVELDPVAFGQYVVIGHVVGYGDAEVDAAFSSYPWGLAAGAVAAAALLVGRRRRRARRRAAEQPAAERSGEQVGEPAVRHGRPGAGGEPRPPVDHPRKEEPWRVQPASTPTPRPPARSGSS